MHFVHWLPVYRFPLKGDGSLELVIKLRVNKPPKPWDTLVMLYLIEKAVTKHVSCAQGEFHLVI